jgi:hypothetical protein
MKILIDDYELIYSGSVIQIKDYPIKVILPDKIEGDFSFIFNFIKDNDEKEIVTKFSQRDRFKLTIDFVNFEKSPEVGNSELIHVGTLREIPLFLQYRVSNLRDAGKTLLFNFYLRREVQNAK